MVFFETNSMIPVGEVIGISVGLGVLTLGLVWASVVKWQAEAREDAAQKALREGPRIVQTSQGGSLQLVSAPRVFRSLLFKELPVGSHIDVESSWGGPLARRVKLLSAREALVEKKPVAILTVQDSAGNRRELTPIIMDPLGRLQNVTFREAV